MTGTGEVSDETRMIAARVRARAAAIPAAAEVTRLAFTAHEMTPAQVRELAAETLTQAQQVSFLLGKLAGLLDDGEGDPREP